MAISTPIAGVLVAIDDRRPPRGTGGQDKAGDGPLDKRVIPRVVEEEMNPIRMPNPSATDTSALSGKCHLFASSRASDMNRTRPKRVDIAAFDWEPPLV